MASNLLIGVEQSRAASTWSNWIGRYTQDNCTPSMAADKRIRIYRTPNHDGRAISGSGWDNWGGIKFTPLLADSNALVKGHTYIIHFLVEGATCDSATSFGWTNNMGWGGGGLSPSPSNVSSSGISGGFNGKKECFYKWTINDDVYKVCTSSYSSFIQGNTYPSYRDFMFGFGYSVTNSVGTDVYVSNVRMYDLTSGTEIFTPKKTGIIYGSGFIETKDSNAPRIMTSGEFQGYDIIEN